MTDAALIGPVSAPDVHVMTFNVRRRTTALPGSPDRWNARAPLVRRLLRAEQPTLLGVQEALADQVDAVAGAHGSRYRRVGRGRSATGGGEHCAIFYDADRLELTAWRQRALSATPDAPGSRSFGNLTRRIVVSAEFTDTATGSALIVFNTHLDHVSGRSRLASAAMILNLVLQAESADPDAAIVVTGDFNAGAGSAVTRRLTAEGALRDAWDAASERLTPPWGTYSNYRAPRPGGSRIDRILVGRRVDVLRAGVNAARFDGRAASDHEPVQAVLRPAVRPTISSDGMIRTSLRRPEGPAEIVGDVLRVLSIVVAGIGWGPLSGLSFVAASAAMLVPRLLRVRPAFDILFGTAVLLSTWSSVLGLFIAARWWDLPMHFFTNGIVAAMLYVVLVRFHVLADAETLPRPVLSAALMVTALGLSLGVLWEFFEWFGRTYLDPEILTGYADSLGDLLQGGLGSLVAGLSMRFLAGRPRHVSERLPSGEAGHSD